MSGPRRFLMILAFTVYGTTVHNVFEHVDHAWLRVFIFGALWIPLQLALDALYRPPSLPKRELPDEHTLRR